MPKTLVSRWKSFLACLLIFIGGGVAGGVLVYCRFRPATNYRLDGEVFLQLKSGDARRAPGATVYIFRMIGPAGNRWVSALANFAKAVAEKKLSSQTAVQALRLELDALQLAALRSEANQPQTRSTSRGIGHASELIRSAECDSEGTFSVKLPPGGYWVIATGRAGLNEAVWSTSVSLSADTKISLGDPVAAYLDTGSN